MTTQSQPPQDLGLSILGLGTQYPPNSITANDLSKLSAKHYPNTPAMAKVLGINQMTGIETRSSIGTIDHPLINQPLPPTISQLHEIFNSDGVPLAVSACRKALAEAEIPAEHITHVVATTCTDSANPGFDHLVASELGLGPRTQKTLLAGVGCSGGLATLRTAANLALGSSSRYHQHQYPARLLCVALEVSTSLARSELESVDREQETRIAACLFSDCASAAVVSNGVPFPEAEGEEEEEEEEEEEGKKKKQKRGKEEERENKKAIYQILGWTHKIIPDTECHLGFDVDPVGWKVVLTPEVPALATASLPEGFEELKKDMFLGSSSPSSSSSSSSSFNGDSSSSSSAAASSASAEDFDWALHPGGITILMGAERELGITPSHMRASYDRYMTHGNSSSATIFSVLDRFREKDMVLGGSSSSSSSSNEMMEGVPQGGRDYVVGAAFGPGISVEMCMLRRNPDRIMGEAAGRRRGSGGGGELDEGYDSQEATT